MKQKKVKHKSISKLKKKAWTIFSLWVRKSAADSRGYVVCVTCGRLRHYKEMQAGHFIPGRHNAILFDPRGCHPQDYYCNIGLKGNPRAYDAYMRKEYGEEVIKELELLDRKPFPFTASYLEDIIKKYAGDN